MESALAERPSGAEIAEQVVILGDLSKLTPEQRMSYYSETCHSLGLNPLTRPFEFITLNNKLTMYATRGCTDQLRAIRRITITSLEPRQVGDLLVVVATGRDYTGREDSSTGAVSVKGLAGEALANAMMKAETKAKRRLTLSLAGLGLSDESEIGSIPSAQTADVDPDTGEIRRPLTLAEKAAEKAAAVSAPPAHELASPAESEPLELTTNDLRDRMRDVHILSAVAMTTARDLFPDWNGSDDLTDRQRGQIWERLNP
ncbi:MAG: hypothetical protein ACRDGQ_15110 [Candidatus Limnocylindrales bacterium]